MKKHIEKDSSRSGIAFMPFGFFSYSYIRIRGKFFYSVEKLFLFHDFIYLYLVVCTACTLPFLSIQVISTGQSVNANTTSFFGLPFWFGFALRPQNFDSSFDSVSLFIRRLQFPP